MKKYLIFLFVFATVALGAAGDRYISNPTQDKNIILQVNDGGVKTDAITIEGSTGIVTIPNGVKPSASSDALSIYDEVSTTVTCNAGCSGSTSLTYTVSGDLVCVRFAASFLNIGGSPAFIMFLDWPTAIRPSSSRSGVLPTVVNSTGKFSYYSMTAAGRVDIYYDFLAQTLNFPASAQVYLNSTSGESSGFCYKKN